MAKISRGGLGMLVLMDGNTYEMSELEAWKLLNVCKNMIPKGIYAIEKTTFIELKNEFYSDDNELNDAIANYARKGFKVHFNGSV